MATLTVCRGSRKRSASRAVVKAPPVDRRCETSASSATSERVAGASVAPIASKA
jgi:hypothetical protein